MIPAFLTGEPPGGAEDSNQRVRPSRNAAELVSEARRWLIIRSAQRNFE